MQIANRILIIDDEVNLVEMLSVSLEKEGYEVVVAGNGRQGLEIATSGRFFCILCDVKMPVMDGMQFLEAARAAGVEAMVIMMSAFATIDTAVKAMKVGAYDFITKPFKVAEVLCVLEKARERLELREENRQLRHKVEKLQRQRGFTDILGESAAIAEMVALAQRVAAYDTTVLITGESGTGKELFARGIHQRSGRSAGPFVSVNCGAIPENLLESEFFGFVKGAFTGAHADHPGLFVAAQGGTLLLDEVGELPLGLQVKLLRVLQEREVRPIGSGKIKKIDVRVLAATARDLGEEVRAGRFRQDLLFRINVVELKIPPLRQRQGDIPLLVRAFLAEIETAMGIAIKGISGGALARLGAYSWPGNVRELKNVIEHAAIYAEDGYITDRCLPEHLRGQSSCDVHELLAETVSIKEGKVKTERYLIDKALKMTGGNKSQAADLLEISYPSLLSKIKEYRIHAGRDDGGQAPQPDRNGNGELP